MNNWYVYFRRGSLSPCHRQGPEPAASRGSAVAVLEGAAIPALTWEDEQTVLSTQVLRIRGKSDLVGDVHKVT